MNKRFCILGALLMLTLFFASGEAQAAHEGSPVEISEVMSANRSTLRAEDGTFPDWVELYNPSSETVSLEGLLLSDRQSKKQGAPLPPVELPPRGRVILFADGKESTGTELHLPFKLSEGETVYLLNAERAVLDELSTADTGPDVSACEDGGVRRVCTFPTPGYENSLAGFAAFQEARTCACPLQINEVKVSDYSRLFRENDPHYDWVELINASTESILLSDYWLSDDGDELNKCRLPDVQLAPGELFKLLCTEEEQITRAYTGFALDSGRESLFLSDADGVADYVSMHDIPYDGSYGRRPGKNGFFYFVTPSEGGPNAGRAARAVSLPPTRESADGLFDGEKPEALTLSGEGTIYYTTDCSYPTENSRVYTGPIPITEDTVVRAVAVQGDNLPSRPLTCTYLLEQHHSLPVVSVVGDTPAYLDSILDDAVDFGEKHLEIPGNITLYENGERCFSVNAGLKVTGKSSRISFPKISLKVELRGAYGDPVLGYDLFGTGFRDYSSFVLRAGQDSASRLFDNEIWQDLCLEMTDSVLTQHGKFCILYVNGAYHGIYTIKENISRRCYADTYGVPLKSVESEIPHENNSADYLAMYDLVQNGNLTDPEVYARVCDMLDVDSFIDWVILEGVSGNYDLYFNVRFFRSPETGNRYQMALFDLDYAMQRGNVTWDVLFDREGMEFVNTNAAKILKGLLRSPQFRESFLRRYGEVYDTVLSNESVLERIDYYEQLLRPEIARDRARWGYSTEKWESDVAALKTKIREMDWQNYCVDRLSVYITITEAERNAYFRAS